MINIKDFLSILLIKKKNDVDYKILSSKVNDISFYGIYDTLYNYFLKFSAEEI